MAGTSPAGTQGHVVALSSSGSRAFVTNGGDGRIVVVDTAKRRVSRTVKTPTPLLGGGYLTVLRRGTAVSDLVAR